MSDDPPSAPLSDPCLAPLSPAWKRPTDVMKIRSKRRKTTATERVPLRPFNELKSPTRLSPQSSPARKRRNPFTCSPNRKRLNLGSENDEVNADSDFLLFQMLDKADCPTTPPPQSPMPVRQITDNVFDDVDGIVVMPSSKEETKKAEEESGRSSLPLDWSLKTKVRFVSAKPFSWSGPMKTQEEANGISLYVRKLNPAELSEQAELKSSTMYWMHPNIPWLTLYPRQVQDSRVGKPSVAVLDEHMIAQLHRDWTQSFASLYNLLKANVCPYFYVLSYQFSVLFRAAGICGEHSALLTPTTRGFREAIANEGIRFTLPLATDANSPESGETGDLNANEDDIQSTDTGASLFLESIGLDKQKFPELNPEKVKMEREDYKRIDSRPESVIQVEAEETKQLFNYLLNCRSCVANTGVQRGIPPTLLAPVAFGGATLKSMQLKQGSVRQPTGPDNLPTKMFTLEASGVILPDSLARMAALVGRTQTLYTASASTHEPTATFNQVKIGECEAYFPVNQAGDDDKIVLSDERRQIASTVRSFEFKNDRYYCSST